ncbi:MAG: ABC transporter substrate-binding protein [Peptococcaceae bacterium]|jgi:putative ABC transport system substrate-binding protein|nr:ABC transporter substrate-binding protein [Peptococcaceae bacterium]
MKKQKLILTLVLVLLLGLLGVGCSSGGAQTTGSDSEPPASADSGSNNNEVEKTVSIGIIQLVEHPALDAAREGFLETLKANGLEAGKNLKVDYQNAQNDQSILNNIAQKFASSKHDLVLAIATPSAQAMAAATSDIPILITAVTDPVTAKLVNSLEKPGTNITGTTDMNPIDQQIDLLLKLVPAAKTVGIVYNAGEINSQVQVEIAKEIAAERGLKIIEATVATSADVLQATQSLDGKVEAIYVPTDNTVVSAADSVVQAANKMNIPIISGESSVVEAGGLGTVGINYRNLGAQTGEMALRVLAGEKPQDMPIESQKQFDIVINKEAAATLGIEIPADLQ